MDKEKIQRSIDDYTEQHQQCTQEAQKLMQQANEFTVRATRLEGAVQALQILTQEEPIQMLPPQEED